MTHDLLTAARDLIPVGVVILDSGYDVVQVDDTFLGFFGARAGDVLGANLDDLLSPRDRKGGLKLHRALARWDGAAAIDIVVGVRVKRCDIVARVRVRGVGGPESGGYFALMVEDLSNGSEGPLLHHLIRENERLKNISAQAFEGVAHLDGGGRLVEYNARFVELMGFRSRHNVLLSEHALADRELAELLSDARFSPLFEAIEEGRRIKGFHHQGTWSHNERWLEIGTYPVFMPIEGFIGSTVIVRDRTDEKLKSEAIEAKEAAEAANVAKSRFLANMSHELRTPLNAIIGYAEMLVEDAQDVGDTHLEEDLRKIEVAGSHLLELINNILDLSKIEAGRMELYLEPFSIQELLSRVRTTVTPLIARNHNDFEVEIAEDLDRVTLDRVKFRQILLNLVSNAAKFTNEGRVSVRIDVDHQGESRWLVCQVRDEGIGISEEHQRLLFREFVQADSSTTRRFGGTGLGLALCARFAEMMGGSIDVESVVDQGSTFCLRLPLGEECEAPVAAEVMTARGGDGTRVVLIDDDPASIELITRHLMSEGYEVISTTSGEEGVGLIRAIKPAAVILDILLGQTDGWSVLSELKASPETASIPVIMVSILEEQKRGFASGASGYVVKPIDRVHLSRLLIRHARTERPARGLVVEDDEATRDLLVKILERDGWEAQSAANGRLAMEMLEDFVPDLILLDLMMPEMDGFEFLVEFKKSPGSASTPVVVVTSRDTTRVERATLEGQVQRIFNKGEFKPENLLSELRAVVR